jgi:atypical dual specificity phosphatase
VNRWTARALFYPTLVWNLCLSRLLPNWRRYDRIDKNLLVGGLPFASDIPQFKAEGVTGIVNTCEEYAGPRAAYEKFGIEQLRVPTVDFTHPSLEHVEQAVTFISRHAEKGGSVLVHCKAGRGRSATVALCYLIASRKLTPEAAHAELAAKRKQVVKSLPNRPVVKEFFARHAKAT